ncbi:MAG: hypothetical protein ACHP9T_08430 [Caulobacterales bacterium]|jgi:hypothetical protein
MSGRLHRAVQEAAATWDGPAKAADPHADYHAYMRGYIADLRAHSAALKLREAAEAKARRREPRTPKPDAPDGHRAGVHGRAKIGEDDVRSIRRRHAAGENRNDLAQAFGVTPRAVNLIVARRRWPHVAD